MSDVLHHGRNEPQAHLPSSELICLGDVGVDHESAAERRGQGPASVV